MGFSSDFFGATRPELTDPAKDFTKMLIGAAQIPGVMRLTHSPVGDYDAQRPVPGLKR